MSPPYNPYARRTTVVPTIVGRRRPAANENEVTAVAKVTEAGTVTYRIIDHNQSKVGQTIEPTNGDTKPKQKIQHEN